MIKNFTSNGICVACLMGLGLTMQLSGEGAKPKMSNVQGLVQRMDKSGMTLTITKGNMKKDIIYSAGTQFRTGHSKSNKPGSVDEIKEGYFLSCSGTYEPGKVQLQAKQCLYRESK